MPTAMTKASGDSNTKPMMAARRCQIGVAPPTTVSSTGCSGSRIGSAAGSTLGIRGVTDALTEVCMLMGVSGSSGCQADSGRGCHWG